jgi:hypothetical protein
MGPVPTVFTTAAAGLATLNKRDSPHARPFGLLRLEGQEALRGRPNKCEGIHSERSAKLPLGPKALHLKF